MSVYSQLQFDSPGGIEIHLVTFDEDDSQYGFYVQVDGRGSTIARFDKTADLDAALAFIMSLQQGVPVAGSAKVQQLLDSLVASAEMEGEDKV